MKRKRCYVGVMLVLYMLSGCGTVPKEKAAPKPPRAVMSEKSGDVATVTDISRESVKEKPDVTRVVIKLDQKANYSTLRNGNQLVVNIHGAKMESSLKQFDVRDPIIQSVTAKQVGNTVKSVIELTSEDIAYRLTKSKNPLHILVDVWRISPTTGMAQRKDSHAASGSPGPVQSISPEASPRSKQVPLDIRETPGESPSSAMAGSTPPPGRSTPAQLQWFSEKLSQVLQEKELLKQQLLDVEKSFAVKDSMIQVLERKLKEANDRIVEVEEELIKAKSTVSLAEENQLALQREVQQLIVQLEQVVVGEPASPSDVEPTEEALKSRSERILQEISVLQEESISLSEIKDQMDALKAQIDNLVKERDSLIAQKDACDDEVATLRSELGKLAAIENELRTKDIQLARLKNAIGAALSGEPVSQPMPSVSTKTRSTTPPPPSTPSGEETLDIQSAFPEEPVTAAEQPEAAPRSGASKPKMSLKELIREHQMMSQSANPGDYVLGPDDVLRIKVLDEEGLDKTITVSSDGFITYPLLGDLRVDGLSVMQLDAQVTSLLARDFLVDPEVVVEVVKPRSKKVYIMGGVKQPGYHELQGEQRLLGTLLEAGGPNSFNTEARILRLPKGDVGSEETLSPIVVDLQKLFEEGDQTQNIVLQDGDVVMVGAKSASPGEEGQIAALAAGSNQFYVVGSVLKPGIYTYKEGDTVLDAVLRAGGFTEFASRNSTKVVREANGKTRTMRVKMKDIMEKGEMEKNITIMPGDMIIVPESFF